MKSLRSLAKSVFLAGQSPSFEVPRGTDDAVIQHDYGIIETRIKMSTLSSDQQSRVSFAYSYYDRRLREMADWVFSSKEHANFTYDVTPGSKAAFVGAVSAATGRSMGEIASYVEEPFADHELTEAVIARAGSEAAFDTHDRTCLFGRRLAWYAVARAIKPRVIVETGVDLGLGSILLAAALRRNSAEGHEGHHFGTDINSQAGFLVHGPWASFSTILYGDSIKSLSRFDQPIDLFINDSDHSADYEMQEYLLLPGKLNAGGIVLGDNSHVTQALYTWSLQQGRHFLFCPEYPRDHWYPGAGIGFSYPSSSVADPTR